ncbi:hypothetical protein N9515_04810 [Vicingaceae bacterium]|nr:hypothetical protein [Vicingaceae bacterium]
MKSWGFLFLFIVTLLVFLNTLSNGYNMDDELVTQNHPLTNPNTEASLTTIFSSSYQIQGGLKSGYRPVTIASYYLEHALFGESVRVSHSVNLILYLAIVLFLYLFLALTFRDTNPYILLFVALLFSVHPVHSEAVASLKNRDELLSLLFFLLSVISSIKWISRENPIYLLSAIVLVSFSILSKKSTLPIIALLPILLLFNQNLQGLKFLKISIVFSIPIGLFAFNLQLIPGMVTFTVLSLFYLTVFYLPIFWESKSLPKPSIFEIFILVVIFSTTIIGVYFQQLFLLITAQLVLLIGIKKHFNMTLLLSAVISILGYFSFYKAEILVYLIMLLSAAALVNKKMVKLNPKFLLGLLPLLFLIAYKRQDYKQILIQLSPLFIFSTVLVNRCIPLILSLIAIIVSAYFNLLSYFQIGILLFSILALSKTELIKLKKIYFAGWLCIAFLFIGVTYTNQVNKFHFYSSATKIIEDSEGFDLKEGRKLEFVENTLVDRHTLDQRFATGLAVMGTYLDLMLYPKDLSFYYGYAKIETTNFWDYKVWISLYAYLLLLYCAIYFFKKQPLFSIGAIWFISCILLFSNLPVLVAGMVGERLAFSASVGFCIMIGGVVNWIKPQFNYRKIRGLEALSIIVLLAFSVRTFARNEKWESPTILMRNDIEHLGNSAHANYLLGVHSIKKTLKSYKGSKSDIQEIQQSIKYFKRAVEIYPKHYNFHIALAKSYLVLDQNKLAQQSFLMADSLEPNAPISLFELAKLGFMLKEYKEALNYSNLYLAQSESNPIIFELAAFSAYYLDDYSLAMRYTEEGLRQSPSNQVLTELFSDLQRRMQK